MGVSPHARASVMLSQTMMLAVIAFALARPAFAQETHLIVITGIEASPEDGAQFHKWAATLIDAAKRKDGVAEANILYLADKPDVDRARIRARSTREEVDKAFTDVAARARPTDQIFVVLLGHGSFDGHDAAFNLPGPDLKAADYAKLLQKFGTQRIVFVNTSSSSGGFLAPLAGPNRTIVAATKTGGERLDTLFPEYFVEALTNEAADKNRDGRISVLEAFDYARTKVAQVYQQKGNVVTEHAALDDGSDGKLADAMFLESPRARAVVFASVADPALRALLEQRQALEDQINALKGRKASMDAAAYEQELEKLVTDLALKTRAIQQLEKKK
ncbi:MAG: hypothetical protein DMF91_15880 [Acidobacteria bacterium]|nr:MAG: hypothetical protein DMF91_15880 [Acidobacteriota bacterium]